MNGLFRRPLALVVLAAASIFGAAPRSQTVQAQVSTEIGKSLPAARAGRLSPAQRAFALATEGVVYRGPGKAWINEKGHMLRSLRRGLPKGTNRAR